MCVCAEAKYGIIFQMFFFLVWYVQFFKKRDKPKFSWLALLFKHFFTNIHPNMNEQKKKRQRIYDLLHAETKPNKFPKYLEFLYGLHQAQTLTPLITLYGGVLENKTNATSHLNIGSFKTAIEEEWNKIKIVF